MIKISNIKNQKLNLFRSSLICLILGILTVFPTGYSWAQDSEADSEAVESIRKTVEEKVQEQNEDSQGEKKGFSGQIADLFNQTIVLETIQGKKTAKTDEETSFIDANRQEINFADLEIGSHLVAMGYQEMVDKLLAKRIVITPKPKKAVRIAIIGQVLDTPDDTISLETLRDEATWEITTTSKTEVSQTVDGSQETTDLDQVKKGDLLVAAGTFEKESELETSTIMILSSSAEAPLPEAEIEQ